MTFQPDQPNVRYQPTFWIRMWLWLWINTEQTTPNEATYINLWFSWVCVCFCVMLLAILFKKETEQVSMVDGSEWIRALGFFRNPLWLSPQLTITAYRWPDRLTTQSHSALFTPSHTRMPHTRTHTGTGTQTLPAHNTEMEGDQETSRRWRLEGTVIVMVTVTAVTYLCFEWEGLCHDVSPRI